MQKYLYIILSLFFLIAPSQAQRKKVAVVLGGGGAKGMAHIGVLKVLEEAGIPIDYVAGTSMGAIVGGLYAIGYTPAGIDSMVRRQDWVALLSDKVERNSQSFPEKENSERYILSLPFGKKKEDRLIRGVVKGQNLQNLFSNLTIGYHDSVDFSTFPIPFACVAVDVVSGKDYVFREGSLPLAMRASMSLTPVFTPVRLDSMVLIDGGINNNYPADVARRMGADIIIGVDLGTSDLKPLDKLNSPADILGQIVALHGYERYRQNCEDTDLLFRPDTKPFNSASFVGSAIDTLISRGEQEARKRWDEILALKESIGFSSGERVALEPEIVSPTDTFVIRQIEFQGIDPRDEKWLLGISRLKENTPATLRKLQDAMSILMGTNAYSHVSYELTGKDPYDLQLIVEPKSISSFNLGLRFDTEDIAAATLNATLEHRARNRSQFAFTGRIGKMSFARLDYSLERSPLRGLNLAYMFKYQDMDIYRHNKKTVNTTYTHHFAELAYSDMNWLNFRMKIGMRYEYYNFNSILYADARYSYPIVPEGYISYFLLAHIETLDRANFPTKGVSIRADYSMYTDNFVGYRGKFPFWAVGLHFSTVVPLTSRLSLLPSVYARGLLGKNPAYPFFNMIGGEIAGRYMPQQLPFAGINRTEIANNTIALLRLHLRQQIGSRHYLSLIGNYGLHNDDLPKLLKGEHLWGGAIEYSYNSIAGPLSASLSMSKWSRNVLFYLSLGFYF
ncbi:MAG: patatin-like phospholipase family protein [Tannerellaceae bacterium]|jgi:NTE family protein|nr:patatin-like phospholipase family protein [Tannerellaceae bacterium]